jgi:TP901 family phage tail tape measure protein
LSTDPELLTLRMRLEGGKEVVQETELVRDSMGRLRDEQGRFVKDSDVAAAGFARSMKRIGSWGKRTRQTGQGLTFGLTLPLVGVGVAAVKSAASFERSMAQVEVATGGSGRQMRQLTRLAERLGAVTKFSAGEAAEAMLELAKSGMTPAQIRGGALKAAMDLAAAGNLNLATAATLTGAAMNTFSLKASQAKGIADALAGGANASAADVSDLGMALAQSGQSLAAYNLNLNEGVGALAAFADSGIRGSDAGTSLKTFLMRLNPVTKKAAEEMDNLGLRFFDARGRMKSLPVVAGELQKGLGGLSQQQRLAAMNVLFGTDAIRAANIFYKQGAGGLARYVRATEKHGAAQKMANAFMRGTAGMMEKARGAMENASIAAGRALAPAIIMLAGVVADLSDWFSGLSPTTQKIIVAFGGFLAVAGPMLMIIGAMAEGIGVLGAALSLLAANPVVLVLAALVAIGVGLVIAYKKVGWFRNAVNATAQWIGNAFTNVKNWIVRAIHSALGFVKENWPYIVGALLGPVGLAAAAMYKNWDRIKDSVGGAVAYIGGKITSLIGWFKSLPGRASGALGDLVTMLADWGKAAGAAFVNALISLVNEGVAAINSTLDDANALSALGVDAPNLPEVPTIGGGGVPSRAPGPRRGPRSAPTPKAQPKAQRRTASLPRLFGDRHIKLVLADGTVLGETVLKAGEDAAAFA